jgi:ribonuclease HII
MKILVKKAVQYLVGIDEVGRGPLAGPVTVGVFGVEKKFLKEFEKLATQLGITDSKKLSEKKRSEIAKVLCNMTAEGKCFFHITMTPATYIDTHGIVPAIRRALENGLEKVVEQIKQTHPLPPLVEGAAPNNDNVQIFLDGGLYAPGEYKHQQTIIKGDLHNILISAASILAKVHRDNYMTKMDKQYPQYGFTQHVGYGTKYHREMIQKHGLSKIHRKSFCRNIILK